MTQPGPEESTEQRDLDDPELAAETAAAGLDEQAATEASHAAAGSTEQLAEELAQSKDKLLRLQAEMENLRRRTRREIEDERKYANLPLMRDLLPVLDNVDRALDSAEKSKDVDSLLAGVKLISQQLTTTLAQHQCHLIEAAGQPFDPNVHEAIMQQPSADHPPGTVTMVTQSGYQLHDRVIRPSQVIVSKAAE